MKRVMLFLCILTFSVASASCIFEDVDDPETAGIVFAVVTISLVFYCAKCVFQGVSSEQEDDVTKHLTEQQ